MNKKFKQIIAREGLIILGIYGGTFLLGLIGFYYQATIISYCIYPLYLLIRFIIWAVRTLKEK